MRLYGVLLFATAIFCLVSCQRSTQISAALSAHAEPVSEHALRVLADTTGDPYWEKRWWLEKTLRLLRYGDGLSSQDDVDSLMKLSEEDIIRQVMKDARFADAIFDFNTYFLGFKVDALKGQGQYLLEAIEISNAVLSAQELMKGGDYFRLFDLRGPVLVPPLGDVRKADDEVDLSNRQVRSKHAAGLQAYLQKILLDAQGQGATGAGICSELVDYKNEYNKVISDGYPLKLFFQGLLLNPDRAQRIQILCSGATPPKVSDLISTVQTMISTNATFFKEMSNFEADTGYQIKTLSDFRQANLPAAGLGDKWLSLSFDQSSALSNSSTNMDRRRGAYMLRQFFCDDLTPVGFDTPMEHTGGEHGSDTSCFACHYKLDPMAGFFRNFGNLWGDFENSDRIIFDDGASTDLATYANAWRTPAGTDRQWNIGYVRSAGNLNVNSYASDLDGLSQILRTAPEVKQCLVRRMFEYFVAGSEATGQSIDAGYLQNLTDQLTSESKQNPTAAVEDTIVRLLTSTAAHTRNLDPETCYDYVPGDDPSLKPPCRVAFLLQKNCVTCHGSTEASGHLDLSKWIALSDGTKTFPHLDNAGKQISAVENLSEISSRLSATDPSQRMPFKKVMSDQDRHELFMWAQQTLTSPSGGGAK